MSAQIARREVETGTQELLCSVERRVAVLTLNRPEARNALTWELKRALADLIPKLGADEDVGALLLTGTGRAFCAGGDTKAMAAAGRPSSEQERLRQLRREHGLVAALHELPRPVIAALPGPAAGAGLSLALACDLRIAARSAFVTTSYVRLGLSGDYGGSWFLTRLVGPARARELYFTGDRIEAEQCERLGLFNRVVPDEDLAREAFELARRIAAGPPIALAYMKDNLNRALDLGLRECLDLEAERMVRGAMTEDYLEAVRAFTEKRPPVFRGR
ncbi:MAG: enoyl-CoA hydratase [Myxococcota bacterium]